ncbi:MAG: hypothetical protein ACRDDZ_06310 [Marinifilaceae bacterium]
MNNVAINENVVSLYFPVKVEKDLEHYYDENRESVAFETEEELNEFLAAQPERIKGHMRQFGLCQVEVTVPDGVTLEAFEDRIELLEATNVIMEVASLLVRALNTPECVEVLENAIIGLQGMKVAKEEGGE